MPTLNPTWSQLLADFKDNHRDPRNQRLHAVAIPLLAGAIPVGATVVGLPLAAGMLTAGVTLQAIGHALEGSRPAFTQDKRALLAGLLWWVERRGLTLHTTPPREP